MIALDFIVEQGAARPLFAIGVILKKRKSGCRWFSYTDSFYKVYGNIFRGGSKWFHKVNQEYAKCARNMLY